MNEQAHVIRALEELLAAPRLIAAYQGGYVNAVELHDSVRRTLANHLTQLKQSPVEALEAKKA